MSNSQPTTTEHPTQQPLIQKQGDIVCVFGATGACGRHLVAELLQRPEIEHVYSFTRRTTTRHMNNPKFHEVILTGDMPKDLEKNFPSSCDAVFSGLATTIKKAGSYDNMHSIDYGLNDTIATYARDHNVPQYYIISSVGADVSSSLWYCRLKGEIEERVKQINFPRSVIIRPGMLIGGERTGEDVRTGEWFVENMLAPLWFFSSGVMGDFAPIDVREVAKFMTYDYIKNRNNNEQFRSLYQQNQGKFNGLYDIVPGSTFMKDELNKWKSDPTLNLTKNQINADKAAL